MTVTPTNDRVIVERKAAEDTSKGGIILPDSAKDAPTEGTVVATGPGRLLDNGERMPMQVKVGDVIMFNSYAGITVEVEGVPLLIMQEDDIYAVIS